MCFLENTQFVPIHMKKSEVNKLANQVQMIFQEPFEAVSPRLTIGEIVREPLDIQNIGTKENREIAVMKALQSVNLPATGDFMARHVHQLSGGQA